MERAAQNLEILALSMPSGYGPCDLGPVATKLKTISEQMLVRSEDVHSHMIHTAAATCLELCQRALAQPSHREVSMLRLELADGIDFLKTAVGIRVSSAKPTAADQH